MNDTSSLRKNISEYMYSFVSGDPVATIGEAGDRIRSLVSGYGVSAACSVEALEGGAYRLRIDCDGACGRFIFRHGDKLKRVSITAFRAAKFVEGLRGLSEE